MKKFWKLLTAICLAASLLLTGCGTTELWLLLSGYTPFSEVEYVHTDATLVEQKAQVLQEQLPQQTSAEKLMDYVYDFYGAYHEFYTNYALANIYYSKDMTDLYWDAEYNHCLESATAVDQTLDQVLRLLAASSLREELESEAYFGAGFFDDFQGESVWTEEFTALMDEEAQLISRYYELSAQALDARDAQDYYQTYGTQLGQLYVELVTLRRQIAQEAGYSDYASLAYDFYYYRDYTPQQAQVLLEEIREELVPLYRTMVQSDVWELGSKECFEKQTYTYVRDCAEAMGGTVKDAFWLLDGAALYDISYGANKYNASFEVFLTAYFEPYIFMNPTLMAYDQLTFAHEFGHFCNDYASGGSMAGIDVAEVFSQGMEYLSLCYGKNTQELTKVKMADCLCVYVEQAMYASFEQQVYSLEPQELTVEAVYALYDQVGRDYGFDAWGWDSRSFVQIPHFFTNPMYVLSYVVSNDAALQIYQLEQKTQGAGLALYEAQLVTAQQSLLGFVEEAQLESPFASGRMSQVRELLETILN